MWQSKNAPDPSAVIREAAFPLTNPHDVARIIATIGDASLVLLGEASHGTHDFYALRARITQALIEQKGFAAVAIEGDWPDAYQVNRLARGDDAVSADEALSGFRRFPTWMWRNRAVCEFVTWLRQHNAAIERPTQRVGFYGLDLYSLHASMRAVVEYLETRDPAAAHDAKSSYSCFEEFGDEPEQYAWATGRLGEESCHDAVARELVALQARRAALVARDRPEESDEFFYAVQNARLAHNAERYYRTMTQGRISSWNLRDEHMAETLDALRQHLNHRGQPPRIVVWAHNSHLGDARATEMGDSGELNLGQLVRERHGNEAWSLGFTTNTGTVVAADDWGDAGRVKRVRPALEGSFERLFHDTGIPRFFLPIERGTYVHSLLAQPRLERAIGVIYRPDTERWSHYFDARLADQFNAVIHLDETRAVEPLETTREWDVTEVPETYPSGV